MARSQQSFNKKEKEKKQAKKRQDKLKKKEMRKAEGSSSYDDMIAYVDQHGNITDTPPDPTKKKEIKAEDIPLGVPEREKEADADRERIGVVTYFDTSKGYGFIREKETQESFFSHINGHLESISERDTVVFRVERAIKGMVAVAVRLKTPGA